GVTPEMSIMTEETFGPVMVLVRVRDDAEAIEIADGTQFGLGATILTKSTRRARRIPRALVTGGVSVNDFGLTYMAQALPFGGAKASGFERLNGREDLRACTNAQSVLVDRFPFHAPAKLYPVSPKSYDVARGVIRTLYGRRPLAKIAGVVDL